MSKSECWGRSIPDTLASHGNLANNYHVAGRNDEAIELNEETLGIMKRVLGLEHPNTLSSRHNLAVGYRAVGRDDDAERLLAETSDEDAS